MSQLHNVTMNGIENGTDLPNVPTRKSMLKPCPQRLGPDDVYRESLSSFGLRRLIPVFMQFDRWKGLHSIGLNKEVIMCKCQRFCAHASAQQHIYQRPSPLRIPPDINPPPTATSSRHACSRHACGRQHAVGMQVSRACHGALEYL